MAPYQPAGWAALPAVSDADWLAGFAAWQRGCSRLQKQTRWAALCSDAARVPNDAGSVRAFLTTRFVPLMLRNADGSSQGLITGYYEPVYAGSLSRSSKTPVPVYGPPNDMITVALDSVYPELKGKRLRGRLAGKTLKPYSDAAEISKFAASGKLDAPVLAWLPDPMDLQFLQVQGSGRVKLADGRELRLGYADQNGWPYRAIGKWLIEQGQLKPADVSMQSIRAWARANPAKVGALLASNPSYVFFRTMPDSDEGPIGSFGVPLTAGYSLAVDVKHVPAGAPMLIDTTRPDGSTLTRLAAAQDTGGAIRGQVRADFFWGKGDAAGELAGKMKQPGKLWLLWPKGEPLPE
ncbi:membrane-bound lytic murein transglycosylase A [Jeongeupia sp. HS-3]|uniref:murein transglycosylase A n=1 Tax=Jeongeupia sp. HS-3 TaxID=1009682 RepID=UPI0018A5C317|nr:MltA domain-containing protein [Jeongeupia sp. HS-3]BCL75469.1 membrane-bound lytic murein transglycosylase A [Jeongeupia sp. HS-3]